MVIKERVPSRILVMTVDEFFLKNVYVYCSSDNADNTTLIRLWSTRKPS